MRACLRFVRVPHHRAGQEEAGTERNGVQRKFRRGRLNQGQGFRRREGAAPPADDPPEASTPPSQQRLCGQGNHPLRPSCPRSNPS